jgi:toxin ParE1/3/4
MMRCKLSPTAKAHLIQIWRYTEQTWGEDQADRYIDGLYAVFLSLNDNRHLWRIIEYPKFEQVYAYVYKKHLIFFRQLLGAEIGIIGIVHQSRDLPRHLKQMIADD